MYKSKKDVDKHVEKLLSKLSVKEVRRICRRLLSIFACQGFVTTDISFMCVYVSFSLKPEHIQLHGCIARLETMQIAKNMSSSTSPRRITMQRLINYSGKPY